MSATKKRLIKFAIILPIIFLIFIFISYNGILGELNKKNEHLTFNKIRILTLDSMDCLKSGYKNLGKNTKTENEIKERLNKIKSSLTVINTFGKVVFDSNDLSIYNKEIYKDIQSQVHYDSSFEAAHPGFFKFALPVVIDGRHQADAIFTIPEELISNYNSTDNTVKLLIPFIIGFGFFIIIFAYVFYKIIKNILKPVESLANSAMGIARGNLEEKISFKQGSEIQSLAVTFDLMREELRLSKRKQDELERSRKELVASISHDLKTPMASIMLYVEGLENGLAKDPETVKKYISVIKKKNESVVKLIDDLFEHSLLDLGNFKISAVEQYSGILLKKITDPLKLQFEKSDVSFEVTEPFPDVLISVDGFRIEQVILNIIQNAVKYKHKDSKILFKSYIDEHSLWIVIKDNGLGIAPEDLPYVFEMFYRGEKSRSRNFGGAGLGLAICKYIVEQHGGKIYVESELDNGTEFIFSIPKL